MKSRQLTHTGTMPPMSRQHCNDGFDTMRGLMVGLALSQVFWVTLAIIVF